MKNSNPDILNQLVSVKIFVDGDLTSDMDFNSRSGNPIVNNFLIYSITKKTNFLKWFDFLMRQDLLNPGHIPIKNQADGSLPFWFPIIYLRKLFRNLSDEINFNEIEHILISYIKYAKGNQFQRNNRFDVEFGEFMLQLPLNKFQFKNYVSYIETYCLNQNYSYLSELILNDFFDKVIKYKNRQILIDYLHFAFKLKPKGSDGSWGSPEPILNNYDLKNFVQSRAAVIYEILGYSSIKFFLQKILILEKQYKYSFTNYSLISIDEDEQNMSTDSYNYVITFMLRNLLDVSPISDKLKFLKIKSESKLITRLQFYIIKNNYSKNVAIKNYFWRHSNPLLSSQAELEVFKLIKNHGNSFSNKQIMVFLSWLNEINKVGYKDHQSGRFIDLTELTKLKWLTAFDQNKLHEEPLIELYDKLNEKLENPTVEHPFYPVWSSSGFRDHLESGNSQVLHYSTPDFLNYIKEKSNSMEFELLQLRNTITQYIQKNPKELINTLITYNELPDTLLKVVIDNLDSLDLNESQKIREFINTVIEKQENQSSLESLIWYFRENAKESENIEELFNSIDFLIKIAHKISPNHSHHEKDQKDLYFYLINTSIGRLYECIFEILIRIYRLQSKGSTAAIKRSIYPPVLSLINKKLEEGTQPEFYGIVGCYLPTLMFLDENWTRQNIDRIITNRNNLDWISFKGYLTRVATVYKNLYDLLVNYYKKMAAILIYEDKITEYFISHISVAFTTDWEKKNEVMDAVLNQFYFVHIKQIVIHFNAREGKIEKNIIEYLWNNILKRLYLFNKEQREEILNKISLFVLHFDDFSEVIPLLAQSAKSPHGYFELQRIIEYFSGKTDNLEAATDIISSIIIHSQIQFSLVKEIFDFTRKLYVANKAGSANKMCSAMVMKNEFEIMELYFEYN